MVSAGVPMESISKMMGHTNIRTTQGYAKVTDDKISEDMDKLIEKRISFTSHLDKNQYNSVVEKEIFKIIIYFKSAFLINPSQGIYLM